MTLALALACLLVQEPKPAPPASAVPEGETPLEFWFKDGLRYRTRDGGFEGRLGGRFMEYYRHLVDRPDDNTPADGLRTIPNTFYTRAARLELEGVYAKEWGFKVQADFSSALQSQSSGAGAPSATTGTLRDAYLEWKRHPEFQLRFGQWLQPVSQEDTTSLRWQELNERSFMNRFMPSRDLGLMAYGALFEKHLDYAVSLVHGNALLVDQGRAIGDSNDEKGVCAWLRVYPFRSSDSVLSGLRLMVGGSAEEVDGVSSGGFDVTTTELSVLYLQSDGGPAFDGMRTRIAPALSWPIGPFALRAEYLRREDELAPSAAPDDTLETSALYVQASVILTGETKKVEERIVPEGSWGAVELAARWSRVEIDDPFATGANIAAAAGNTDRADAFSAGVNWWVTRNVRFSANVIVEKYDDELQFDNGRVEDSMTGFLFRGQVDF